MFTLAMLVTLTLVLLTQADGEERKVTIVLARTGLTCQDLVQAKTPMEKAVKWGNRLSGKATAQSNPATNRLMGNGDSALSGYGIIRLGEIKEADTEEMTKVDMTMAAASTAAVWTAGILFGDREDSEHKTIHTARMLTTPIRAPNNKAIEKNLDNFKAPKSIQLTDKYDANTKSDQNQTKRWEAFEQVLVAKVLPDLAVRITEEDIVIGVVVDSSMFKFKAGCAKEEGKVSAGQVVKLEFAWEPQSAMGRDALPTGKFLQTESACTAMAESGTSFVGDFCESDLGLCQGMISASDTSYKRMVEEELPHAQQRLQKATKAATKAADVAAKAKQAPDGSLKASATGKAGGGGFWAKAKKGLTKLNKNAIKYVGSVDEKAKAAEHEREKLNKDFEELVRLAKEKRDLLSALTCKNGQKIELAAVNSEPLGSLATLETWQSKTATSRWTDEGRNAANTSTNPKFRNESAVA